MAYPPIIAGLAGVVAGVVIGIAISGSRVTDRINTAVSSAMERAQAEAGEASGATEEAIAELGDRISALETQVTENTSSTTEISEAVRTQIGDMQEALSNSIAEVGDRANEGSAQLQAALEDMRTGMQERMQEMRSRMMGAGSGEDDAGETADGGGASAPAQVPEDAEGVAARVGETVRFGDGAVRAFVSRVDAEGGSARISVNGELATLAVGEAVMAALQGSECAVSLVGIDGSSATLASDCGGVAGGEGAAAEGETNAGESAGGDGAQEAAADVPAAPDDGYRAGEVAQFADGALRVFISGLAPDGSAARLAINGIGMQMVTAGESVDVPSGDQTCTVTVTGVGDGIVGLEGNCG